MVGREREGQVRAGSLRGSGRGGRETFTDRPENRSPIFDGMSAAREEFIFRKWGHWQHDDWPLFASWDQQWQWLYAARRPWPRRHSATRKRPSHGGRCIDYVGGGQIVKAAVGAVLTSELTGATRLPACLRALLTPFRPATRDLAAEAETVEILQVALSERGRQQLQTAGKRAGVKVLLSRENGRRFEFADI